MRTIKEKKERRLGVKLFLKADRCNSPKCVMIRKPYKPGVHGKKGGRPLSDFGKQLQEKQKIQIIYGLTNRQLQSLFRKKEKEAILLDLERRLDRVVYLLGFARSPRIARQIISHGHIMVGGKKVTISSYRVKVGDVISIRPESSSSPIFFEIPAKNKDFSPPEWLKLNQENLRGECVQMPQIMGVILPFDINLVGQFYSR